GWNLGEREGLRGPAQPGQVFGEPEDPAVVEPQPFPDRIAALHDRVERADAGLIPVREPAADADQQIAVALVEGLLHYASLASAPAAAARRASPSVKISISSSNRSSGSE